MTTCKQWWSRRHNLLFLGRSVMGSHLTGSFRWAQRNMKCLITEWKSKLHLLEVDSRTDQSDSPSQYCQRSNCDLFGHSALNRWTIAQMSSMAIMVQCLRMVKRVVARLLRWWYEDDISFCLPSALTHTLGSGYRQRRFERDNTAHNGTDLSVNSRIWCASWIRGQSVIHGDLYGKDTWFTSK